MQSIHQQQPLTYRLLLMNCIMLWPLISICQESAARPTKETSQLSVTAEMVAAIVEAIERSGSPANLHR